MLSEAREAGWWPRSSGVLMKESRNEPRTKARARGEAGAGRGHCWGAVEASYAPFPPSGGVGEVGRENGNAKNAYSVRWDHGPQGEGGGGVGQNGHRWDRRGAGNAVV